MPINKLRNIAINNTLTPFIFYVDVDFVPHPNLHQLLTSQANSGFFNGAKVRTHPQYNYTLLIKIRVVYYAF